MVHHNKARKAYRDRILDAHRAGMAALRGEEIPEPIESEPEDMGDSFSIQGDTHYTVTNPTPTEQSAPAKKPMGTLAKAAIAAALLGSGAGGMAAAPWIVGLFNQQPPAVEMPADSSTQVVVE